MHTRSSTPLLEPLKEKKRVFFFLTWLKKTNYNRFLYFWSKSNVHISLLRMLFKIIISSLISRKYEPGQVQVHLGKQVHFLIGLFESPMKQLTFNCPNKERFITLAWVHPTPEYIPLSKPRVTNMLTHHYKPGWMEDEPKMLPFARSVILV